MDAAQAPPPLNPPQNRPIAIFMILRGRLQVPLYWIFYSVGRSFTGCSWVCGPTPNGPGSPRRQLWGATPVTEHSFKYTSAQEGQLLVSIQTMWRGMWLQVAQTRFHLKGLATFGAASPPNHSNHTETINKFRPQE